MNKASTIGLDLAKQVFQVHGADATGAVVFRKRLRRTAVLQFFASQAPCRVAMEACASSHYWGGSGEGLRLESAAFKAKVAPRYFFINIRSKRDLSIEASSECYQLCKRGLWAPGKSIALQSTYDTWASRYIPGWTIQNLGATCRLASKTRTPIG